VIKSEHLTNIMEKYSEHLEMLGDNSNDLIIKILSHELSKQTEKTKYLERRLKLLELVESHKCNC